MDVSIIIPVFHVELYIEDCLRSVMRQTLNGEIECLLVDDCGEDDSIALAERMVVEYNDNLNDNYNLDFEGRGRIRFRILHHERNKGLSAARNTGIQHATGDYMFFLDSDDTITTNCITDLMRKAKADPAIELVQGNTKTYPQKNPDPRTKEFQLLHAKNNGDVRSCLFEIDQFPAFSWNKLVKRSFVLEHQLWFKEGVLYEDNLWQFHLIKHLRNVCFVQDITYIYRVRSNSIMTGTKIKAKAENLGIVYHEILNDLTKGHEKEEYEYYAKGLAQIYFLYAHASSILKDDFHLCWEKKSLGSIKVKVLLVISYILDVTCLGRVLITLRK